MRKSTVMIMAMLMVCFGTLLVAASVLSKPMKQDAQLAKELTRLLTYQEAIESGTQVSVFRRPAAKDKTLADEGRGVVVRLRPSVAIKGRRGGLRAVLARIVSQVRDSYSGSRLDWIEFQLESPETPTAEPFRTLVKRASDGEFGPPRPAVS